MHAIALLFALLTNHASHEAALQPGEAHRYELQLRRGESADVVVQQKGIDVVVELRGPGGALLDAVDGPTGRNGDERAEIVAGESGTYAITVRPYDGNEPAGRYRIEIAEVRSVAATRAVLQTRREERGRAAAWLRAHSAPLSGDAPPIAELAARARVIGLGEATHGSREFGDVRLALTRRLVEEHGVRVVAVEASSSRLAALAPYLAGSGAPPAATESWIGGRTLRELVAWLRAWNVAHPTGRVRLAGVDPQDNAIAREELRAFVTRAYADFLPRWNEAEKELAAADEQTAVFGDSSVKPEVRQTLFELVARLSLDAAVLRARYGAAAGHALDAARTLAFFADFNSAAPGARSRDWAMANAVLRALDEAGPDARAVYWAHNAHVRTNGQTSGAFLRAALGCGYAAVAQTFGEGSFVAQVPNDAGDRLAVSTLPRPADESAESVFALFAEAPVVAAWPCSVDGASLPAWLRAAHPMHWIGALWTPGSAPTAAMRPFDLLHDLDGVVYLPRVTADEVPAARPHIPPRRRN
jgi:erythromycin esterase